MTKIKIPIKSLSQKLYSARFYLLLVAIIANLFFTPFIQTTIWKLAITLFTTSCILLAGVNFIQYEKKYLRNFTFFLGLTILVFLVLESLHVAPESFKINRYYFLLCFFSIITVSLLHQLFSIQNVTANVIVGSFCGYLLTGIIFVMLFTIIYFHFPGSLSGIKIGDTNESTSQIFYFTFTTMTTIGYGDITPSNSITQKLAVFTAAIGQFYIAIVVALLVSRFIETRKKN